MVARNVFSSRSEETRERKIGIKSFWKENKQNRLHFKNMMCIFRMKFSVYLFITGQEL